MFGYGLDAKPEWQKLSWEGEVTAEMAGADGMQTIAFNLASAPAAATFYINNVTVEKETGAGVSAVEAEGVYPAGVYNLQGVKVADSLDEVSAAGIYVANGKKHVVK